MKQRLLICILTCPVSSLKTTCFFIYPCLSYSLLIHSPPAPRLDLFSSGFGFENLQNLDELFI